MSWFRVRRSAVLAVGLTVGALASSGVSWAATAGPDQGVTNKAIKIGFISSKTGVAASTSGSSDIGCKARIGRQNAAGGVNGRKLEVEYVDDASSAANLTQAQSLVQNDHRNTFRLADEKLMDIKPEVYLPMIDTAENVAKRYGISRESQDEYGLESQRRVAAAREAGRFDDEIAPIDVPDPLEPMNRSFSARPVAAPSGPCRSVTP